MKFCPYFGEKYVHEMCTAVHLVVCSVKTSAAREELYSWVQLNLQPAFHICPIWIKFTPTREANKIRAFSVFMLRGSRHKIAIL